MRRESVDSIGVGVNREDSLPSLATAPVRMILYLLLGKQVGERLLDFLELCRGESLGKASNKKIHRLM